MAHQTVKICGYWIILYDFYNQYEIHVKLEGEPSPSDSQMRGIVNYLKEEGFIIPPKKVHLAIVETN